MTVALVLPPCLFHDEPAHGFSVRVDRLATPVVCAWCRRLFVNGRWVVGPHPETVSHGMCSDCRETLRP